MKCLISLGVLVSRSVNQLDVLEYISEVCCCQALLIILYRCLSTLSAKYLKRAISRILTLILALRLLTLLALYLILPTLRLILMPRGDLSYSMCLQRTLILSFLSLLWPFVDNVIELCPTGRSREVRYDLLEVWHNSIHLLGF